VRFLSLAARVGVGLEDLARAMTRYPQVLENVLVADPGALERATPVWEAVARAQEALGDRGRVLVRPSGTEPLVRVMVEAESADEAQRQADALAEVVRVALG
jgi:phosphoglucosamine mutase